MTSTILIFGVKDGHNIVYPEIPLQYERNDFQCFCFENDKDLDNLLIKHKPILIGYVGDLENHPRLMDWPGYKVAVDKPTTVLSARFIKNINKPPKVSVFTVSYKSGDKIWRPFRSLKAQTFQDWEWVVVDDSDCPQNWLLLQSLAAKDSRIRLYRGDGHSGVIGHLKRTACDLCRGEFLVELDHDDELTDIALQKTVEAFENYPEVGFVYSDFAECWEDGTPAVYTRKLKFKAPYTDWGFGYGSYREETINGLDYKVVNAPNINSKTIRHIIAAPNHLRAWRKTVYNSIGGHNPLLPVADDYELMVRTFLATRMCRVPVFGYVQYRNADGNTHRERNKDIQRLVRAISTAYDDEIHKRFIELGVKDFAYLKGETFDRLGSIINPPEESHCTIYG